MDFLLGIEVFNGCRSAGDGCRVSPAVSWCRVIMQLSADFLKVWIVAVACFTESVGRLSNMPRRIEDFLAFNALLMRQRRL